VKILIATNHSYMLYQFRRELIAALSKYGNISVSTPFVGHEDELTSMGCKMIETKIDRRGVNPASDIRLFLFYLNMFKEEKPDCVITYSIKPNIYASFACRCLSIPCYINVQGLGSAFQKEPIAAVVSYMYKIALKKVHTVFFENEENKKVFINKGIINNSKCCVLNGAGVNVEKYTYSDYPSEENGLHFSFLGRIMKEKGIEEFFFAAEILKHRYGSFVTFNVVGNLEDEYRNQIDELQTKEVITYHGFQPDPIPYYQASHCIVLPSYHEGMSNVLLEAASIGRAIITTDIPGCREVVENGASGFLCNSHSVESLIACLERFIQQNEEGRKKMGQLGRMKIEREFNKNLVIKKTLSCFEFSKNNINL